VKVGIHYCPAGVLRANQLIFNNSLHLAQHEKTLQEILEGLERMLPCGGVYHYRCWLPVLISAAYSAVHSSATAHTVANFFSAAYSAVH
tara:strand:+ start:1700 stop:1966 length:267 start_codon:yes stop_codon:yes gene_type:complete